MKCKNCGSEMVVDDIDRHSNGNRDKYLVCKECDTGCVERIRNNVVVNIVWQDS